MPCIEEWSRISVVSGSGTRCPLCKQSFAYLIHDVKSETNFKKKSVIGQSRLQAIKGSVYHEFPFSPAHAFRATIYREEAYATFLGANPGGRTHELTRRPPTSLLSRQQQALTKGRLQPWLERELQALTEESDVGLLRVAVEGFLSQLEVTDGQLQVALEPFLSRHTRHFLHELHVFVDCHFSLRNYDLVVSYPALHRQQQQLATTLRDSHRVRSQGRRYRVEVDVESDEAENSGIPGLAEQETDTDDDVQLVGRKGKDEETNEVELIAFKSRSRSVIDLTDGPSKHSEDRKHTLLIMAPDDSALLSSPSLLCSFSSSSSSAPSSASSSRSVFLSLPSSSSSSSATSLPSSLSSFPSSSSSSSTSEPLLEELLDSSSATQLCTTISSLCPSLSKSS
eukprot:gb/GEZN01005601.1/.p1 GENE.gb/GEZN01005601.1/~~gb/GEZN01005601.1/.p1  ORF type:complete len:396 (+),score=50.03 gb/GEZN01005601.1/:263-1450(+)